MSVTVKYEGPDQEWADDVVRELRELRQEIKDLRDQLKGKS